MFEQKTDVLIVGGGLVGLSTAMQLLELLPDLTVTLIEKDGQLAAQQSGHNSGVIHAGIYYEPGSRKAEFCVEGHAAMVEFCIQHGIPVLHCGKVIVANTDDEIGRLEDLFERGLQNRVPDLKMLDKRELKRIEPHVQGEEAIHVPHSAVVDYRKVAAAYASVFQSRGGNIRPGTAFESGLESEGICTVQTSKGPLKTRLVINCGGLHADVIARSMGTKPGMRIIPFRGEYYALRKECRYLVNGLVYPVPNPKLPFLGVHMTPRMNGSVLAGPNALMAMKREGYERRDFALGEFAGTLSYPGFWFMAARHWKAGLGEIWRAKVKRAFVENVRRLVPDIRPENLVRTGSGVRAQAVDGKGRLIHDFHIEESPAAIHVLNAPSPAATSSLMIGRHVALIAEQRIMASLSSTNW